jgi:hypothetical protein
MRMPLRIATVQRSAAQRSPTRPSIVVRSVIPRPTLSCTSAVGRTLVVTATVTVCAAAKAPRTCPERSDTTHLLSIATGSASRTMPVLLAVCVVFAVIVSVSSRRVRGHSLESVGRPRPGGFEAQRLQIDH